MADLITLAELKTALGVDPTDSRKDALYTQRIPWASDAIRNFTGRDFGTALVTEDRTFAYDGSGFLDIDDATTITQVRFTVPNSTDLILDDSMWYAAPPRRDDSPVFYYIVMTAPYGYSPAMGFERNMDALALDGRLPQYTRTAVVSGTWGWPDVPGEVKLALVWTIQDWTSNPSGSENLSSEAIEGYSRSWGGKGSGGADLAIPNRARDLLANYSKTLV